VYVLLMNIYESLGVRKVINACGTVTKLGGTLMAPEVLEAMREAAEAYVELPNLYSKASEKIAELLGVEAVCITSGAAAGIAISAAACMTRGDPLRALQLPDTTGMPYEVVMFKSHRTLYDQALTIAGAKIREVDAATADEMEVLEDTLHANAAMFFYVAALEHMPGSLPLSDISVVMKKHQIPVVVDAAAELPPVSNITHYIDQGADLVIFSGGKEIRGPQSSGLILGRKEWVDACNANNSPNFGVGRCMKLDKETIAGITKAVELFIRRDYREEIKRWESMALRLFKSLAPIPCIELREGRPEASGVRPAGIPRVFIHPRGLSAAELQYRLIKSDPAVHVDVQGDEIVVNPQCLNEFEVGIVVRRIKAVLCEALDSLPVR